MPTPLPSKSEFQNLTRHVGKSKLKSRGRIRHIDDALDQWTDVKHGNDRDLQVAVLWIIHKECRKWIKEKETQIRDDKGGESTILRWNQVQILRATVEEWLEALVPGLKVYKTLGRFEARKAQGVNDFARGLQGIYRYERSEYLRFKKHRAPSITDLEGDYSFPDPMNQQRTKQFQKTFKGKSFGSFSLKEFQKLDRLTNHNVNVLYMKKQERLKYMVFVKDGLLCDAEDQPVTWDGTWTRMYTMDCYGNLFVTTDSMSDFFIENKNRGRQNHSTLVSGREVICAGTIIIKDGFLEFISNNSGHYKPTRRQLWEAIQVLSADGADLSQAKVECREPSQNGNGNLAIIDYNATDFAVDMNTQTILGMVCFLDTY